MSTSENSKKSLKHYKKYIQQSQSRSVASDSFAACQNTVCLLHKPVLPPRDLFLNFTWPSLFVLFGYFLFLAYWFSIPHICTFLISDFWLESLLGLVS